MVDDTAQTLPGSLPRMPPRLALVELHDDDGRVLQAWDVTQWPVRIGRALDNDLVLHDPHVSAHQAVIELDGEGRLMLVAGTGRNSVRVEEGAATLTLKAGQQAVLAPLARWHVGSSTLRVRRADDPLPEEPALAPRAGAAPPWLTMLLVALAALWTGAALWLENDADTSWEDYLPPVLALVGGAALWAGLWGLASKIFTRRFALLPHLRVLLIYMLAIALAEALLGLLAYAFDWAWASRIRGVVAWGLAAALVAHHLRLVLPARSRRVNVAVAAVGAMGIAWTMALQWQRTDRFFEELYMATLAPPAWRLVGAQPPEALLEDLRSLEAPLRERARKAAAKEQD